MHPVIYAADIGSIKAGNFGWARLDPEQGTVQVERNDGTEIAELVDAVLIDLEVEERGVALGFECPLFVPVPENPFLLGKARAGEFVRAFSGRPGTAALVTGLVQTAWILRALRERCPEATAFLDWDEFAVAGKGLFLWEAFVTGKAKADSHVGDALIAATTFRDALPNPPAVNAVEAEKPLSLIGAALLWSGWSPELAWLDKPCLVLKSVAPDDTLDHPVAKANYAVVSKSSRSTDSLHERVSRIAEQIPRGTWTTYGDVATMSDEIDAGSSAVASGVTIPIAVGGVLKQDPTIPNAHRILKAKGKIAKEYPFPIELLKSEGIRFPNGRADPQQRWHPAN